MMIERRKEVEGRRMEFLQHMKAQAATTTLPQVRGKEPKSAPARQQHLPLAKMSEAEYLVEQLRQEKAKKEAESLKSTGKASRPMYGVPKSPRRVEAKEEKYGDDSKGEQREAALKLKKQAITELEIKRNLDSIKKSWKQWGTQKKEAAERIVQINDRTEYASHYQKLGAKMHPVHLEYSDSRVRRPLGLHQMTEQ